jgi:hypothetical protein
MAPRKMTAKAAGAKKMARGKGVKAAAAKKLARSKAKAKRRTY